MRWKHRLLGIQELRKQGPAGLFSSGSDKGRTRRPSRRAARRGAGTRDRRREDGRFGGDRTGAQAKLCPPVAGERCRLLVRADGRGPEESYTRVVIRTAAKEWEEVATVRVDDEGQPMKGYN